MNQTAAGLLMGASTDFLRHFSPFDRMEPEALAFLAEHAALGFHPRGSAVLTPEMGPPQHFYIIQRGKVQARQQGPVAVTGYTALTLGPGECFPIGAVSAQRPSTNSYLAVEDSFIFQVSVEQFMELMRISPVFHLFCTQYIASLLNQSRQQLQTAFVQRAAEQQSMTTPLGELVRRAPVHVLPDTPARAALEKMDGLRIGCIVVADEDGHPVGVFTQSDLLPRVVLPAFDLARPIEEIMTPAPRRLPASASAYEAALEMATYGVRHLLVVDVEGRLSGVVSERDLFSLQRLSLRQVRASIDHAGDIEALQRTAADIRALALNLIAQGVGAEQLTRFISALNDALTQRVIALALECHDLYGIDYAWLAFGSEGRHEQTLSTDQDNGLIFVCPELMDKEPLKLRLLEFAREVNNNLAACGFPLCKGNIMASNPDLCLTQEEWRQRFVHWIGTPDPQALLNASIFFDFRVLYGNRQLGDQLQNWLNKNARADSAFQRLLAVNALQVAPPLGRLRDFTVEDDGSLDLKKYGTRLFIDAARIFALRTGVSASGTVQRLRQSAVRMGISSTEIDAIIDGFHFIQLLRLRAQHLETGQDAPGGNCIHPDRLNELDRRILKEAFRQARKLQSRLRMDYQL